MKILIILNDPPYGTERSYNGLRLSIALQKANAELVIFLLADAVICAKCNQQVPQGHYSIEQMLKSVLRKGEVLICGACMDARGMLEQEIVEGRSAVP
jgi:uncharacterized protein involved in oxidation of intracellular sulfur